MDWGMVTGVSAGFGAVATAFTFIVKSIVRDEMKKLNGFYLKSDLAMARFQQIEDHFDFIEERYKIRRGRTAEN